MQAMSPMKTLFERLLSIAKRTGSITQEEIMRFLPESIDLGQLDQLFMQLTEAGVKVIDQPLSDELFSEVYEHFRNRVFAIALVKLEDSALAEEVVQDTFLKLWVHRYMLTAEKVPGWLSVVAYNQATDIIRRRRREVAAVNLARYGYQMENVIVDHADLVDAMESLPWYQREAVEMVYYRGHSMVEVAARLGISENTVSSRKRLALGKLREKMVAASVEH